MERAAATAVAEAEAVNFTPPPDTASDAEGAEAGAPLNTLRVWSAEATGTVGLV